MCLVASVRPSMWVCGTYVVHHFDSAELCCAPLTCVVHHHSWGRPNFFITNMQNHLVHHLIGTEPSCALLKCMSVQNYIVNVNLDLHVRRSSIMHHVAQHRLVVHNAGAHNPALLDQKV